MVCKSVWLLYRRLKRRYPNMLGSDMAKLIGITRKTGEILTPVLIMYVSYLYLSL